MLSTDSLQNLNSIGGDRVNLLFNQLTESNKIFTKKTASNTSGFIKDRQSDSHWSNQLFASAATGIKPYDKLVVIKDRKKVYEFEFRNNRSEIVIGSHSLADIVLESPKILPFHAKISCVNGEYQIEDLGSENGTYLNGKKLITNEAQALSDGSSFHIMAFRIRFESQGQQALKTSPAPLDLVQISPLWQKGITELQVTDIIDETCNVKTFRLVGISPLLFSYLPGQYVTLLLNIEGKEVQRSYSMSSSPSRPHTLDITVKRLPGGLVSNWLCDSIKRGDKIKVKGPIGRFSCLKKPSKKVLFIGAGSGITPLMSMSRWLFDTASNVDTKVLFSFRHHNDIIYKKELEMMADSAKAMDFAMTLTGSYGKNNNWKDFSGRIDHVMLQSFVNDLNDRDVFLCGPKAFMKGVKSLLEAMNYPMQRLHCESFNYTPTQSITKPEPQAGEPKIKADTTPLTAKEDGLHTVTFAKSNKVVHTDETTSLLQLAEAQGIEIDYDCETGSCGECMVKCLSGQAEMSDDCEIDEHEREQGLILSCCAFARSDLVLNA
jgi:ferredoxin-NADP reductase